MKVYKDIDEVIKPTEVPRELWEYENEMKKKPKFDKCKNNYRNLNKKKEIVENSRIKKVNCIFGGR